jgi:nucleotide-binding universal stress UspA family protein
MKQKVSKVLVAIDGSDHSLRAAEYALKIAKNYGSKLFAVTVTYIPEKYKVSEQELIEHPPSGHLKMEEAETWFEKFTQRAKQSGIQLRAELLNSHRPVDYVILEYAEKEGIDLIVIGTRGTSGPSKLLLGSVASRVITYSHCPILAVK